MVNPVSNHLNQLLQLEQTRQMEDGRLFPNIGVRRGWGLIGPLSRQCDRAGVVIEERENFAASGSAHLEDKKPFSRQGVERVSYGRPSQMSIEPRCSLMRVSRRCRIGGYSKCFCRCCNPSSIQPLASTVTVSDRSGVRKKRCARRKDTCRQARIGWWTWTSPNSSTTSTTTSSCTGLGDC